MAPAHPADGRSNTAQSNRGDVFGEGELAPFSLLTYDDVKQHARQIATVTKSRFMPPWQPDHGADAFVGERRLTDDQIQIFSAVGRSGGAGRRHPRPAGGSRVRVHVAPRRTRPRRLDAEAFDVPADARMCSETSCCACRLRRSASFKPLNFVRGIRASCITPGSSSTKPTRRGGATPRIRGRGSAGWMRPKRIFRTDIFSAGPGPN